MKFWTLTTSCTVFLLILSGCGTSPTPPKELKIDSSLPMVKLTQNGVIADMKTVAFEWNSIKDPRVEGIYVYKENFTPEDGSVFEEYANITNRFQTHYLDQNVEPDSKYNYKFRTYSKDTYGVESKIAHVTTLPLLSSVSWIHSITGMPRSAKIIWRPHSSHRVNAYIIERKTLEDEQWEEIDTVKGRLNAEYIDEGLDDNYVYIYRIKAVTYDGIVSVPGEGVKVVTKALPRAVVNIKTTNNLAKKIKIDWDASTQSDFELYHVYRSSSIDGSYDLVAKLHNSHSFTDVIDEDGKSFFYRVSVIDKDGLESEHEKNSIHGMTLPKPSAPAIVEAELKASSIELMWSKADSRARTYIVEKTQTKGWFDTTSETYEGISSQHFIDKNILPSSKYYYTVYSVDKDGVKSDPSIEVKIETLESTEIEHAPVSKKIQKEVKIAPKSDTTQEVISPMENLDLNEI